MATVRGQLAIFTKRTARKRYRCDGPHDTYFASDVILPGDVYFRAALPPDSELGNFGWWVHRLCWSCAPAELTSTALVARIARGEVTA